MFMNFGRIAAGQNDGGAALGEHPRRRQPHAFGGARDQGHLAFEVIDRVHLNPHFISELIDRHFETSSALRKQKENNRACFRFSPLPFYVGGCSHRVRPGVGGLLICIHLEAEQRNQEGESNRMGAGSLSGMAPLGRGSRSKIGVGLPDTGAAVVC
jgi:hypothetical protein